MTYLTKEMYGKCSSIFYDTIPIYNCPRPKTNLSYLKLTYGSRAVCRIIL